ncbi:MAG: glutaredoxin family protein [Gammaproteobacteria bacterium]|nr:glutaredoxin family protein [Gammaproteobacteria bacterium]
MQVTPLLTAFPVLLSFAAAATDVTVYQCTDPTADKFYADRCPPGTTKEAEMHLQGTPRPAGGEMAEVARAHPVTLYAVPACDACDLVRTQLNRRGIPYTEKDASKDIAVQNELKEAAGALSVPVVRFDDQVLTGYDRNALEAALDAVGFPREDAAAATDVPESAPEEPTPPAQAAVP